MSAFVKTALLALSVTLSVGAAEIALRVARFHFSLAPIVQFGWPDPSTITQTYRSDPDLLWVPRDYTERIAAARREPPVIVFMGDSCTEFGTYPTKTVLLLLKKAPSLATGIRVGVGGWSSEQGRAQLHRDVIPIHPKLITIYYGWNDHWVALGPTDPDLTWARGLAGVAEHVRLAQLLLKARMGMVGAMATRPNRVPIDRYLDNLKTMIRDARLAAIVPVVITAPSNHVAGHEPEYLAERHVRSLRDVVPLHQQYLAATREAARSEGAMLCDVADHFTRIPEASASFFQRDGIHLTDAGDRALATFLSDCIIKAAPHADLGTASSVSE